MIKAGEIRNTDGIIIRDKMISSDWEEYQELKEGIDGKSDGLTICSLTLVGEEK